MIFCCYMQDYIYTHTPRDLSKTGRSAPPQNRGDNFNEDLFLQKPLDPNNTPFLRQQYDSPQPEKDKKLLVEADRWPATISRVTG